MLAHRAAGVLGAEDAAPLKNGHDAIDEVLQAVRQRVRHQVEAVGSAALEPMLDVVGDLFGGADDDAVPAAAGQCADQFARRVAVAPRERERGVEEGVVAVAAGRQGQVVGQALVELQLVGREAQRAGQTRVGSTNRPAALSPTKASSSQLSHSAFTTAVNSVARA